jgi:uncharacterized membrane protein
MSELMSDLFITSIQAASRFIEFLAVIIIVGAVVLGTGIYLRSFLCKRDDPGSCYTRYKESLGRSLLLGLEVLVAADVIRTVALEQTLESIISLGLLVFVRTFLSWALVVEIEGRWPWQPVREGVIGR